jgi:hypothetical protein
MTLFLAFHKIAAQRGDGLRPELLRLLENAKAEAEATKPAMKIVEGSNRPATISDGQATKASTDAPLDPWLATSPPR